MEDDWVKIAGSSQLFIVEMYKGLLDEHSIKSILMNKTDSMHLHLTNADVELYVRNEDVLRAKHLIEKTNFE
jgi:hypothetical protein